MRRQGGYLITADPLGSKENDTVTCGHCQTVFDVKPFCDPADIGGRCNCCDKLLCPKCSYRMFNLGHGCVPLEEHLNRVEKGEEIFGAWHLRQS